MQLPSESLRQEAPTLRLMGAAAFASLALLALAGCGSSNSNLSVAQASDAVKTAALNDFNNHPDPNFGPPVINVTCSPQGSSTANCKVYVTNQALRNLLPRLVGPAGSGNPIIDSAAMSANWTATSSGGHVIASPNGGDSPNSPTDVIGSFLQKDATLNCVGKLQRAQDITDLLPCD